jgi:hypothetical protein
VGYHAKPRRTRERKRGGYRIEETSAPSASLSLSVISDR